MERKWTAQRVRRIKQLIQDSCSLEEIVYADGPYEHERQELIADITQPLSFEDALDEAYKAERDKIVMSFIEKLRPREYQIVCMRNGINHPQMTLQQCADIYGVTRERIRQIEAKAYAKIRPKLEKALAEHGR